jgi:SAM-dependent methyltransferase
VTGGAHHWDGVYAGKEPAETSWFEGEPTVSLRLIDGAGIEAGSCIDVGAGRSTLVDSLLARGWRSVTVLDLSPVAVEQVRARVGDDRVTYVVGDVLEAVPDGPFDCWHDRAVLHFLTTDADRARYGQVVARAVGIGGVAVIGCFAPDGPEQCSGLDVRRASAEDLAALLAPAFAVECAERVEHTTPWGSVQPFTWVVLRRV